MATTFFYFGSISLDFVFHLFFLFVIFFYIICFKFYQNAKPLHFFNSMRYSRMLEESSFANKKADYFWLLLQSSVMLLVNIHSHIPSTFNLTLFVFSFEKKKILSPLFNLPFLSSSLAFVPIYLWSRRHPSTPISLFGLFTITAPYLPIALVAFSWVLSGTWKAAAGDLVGCAVGHIGWFLRDVWTREMVGGTSVFTEAPVRL